MTGSRLKEEILTLSLTFVIDHTLPKPFRDKQISATLREFNRSVFSSPEGKTYKVVTSLVQVDDPGKADFWVSACGFLACSGGVSEGEVGGRHINLNDLARPNGLAHEIGHDSDCNIRLPEVTG